MKILLLTDSLTSGGMERRLIELIKGFGNYPDINLHLVVFSDNIHYQEVFERGIPITILRRVPKRNPLVFYRLFKLCKSWKPDLIHSWGSMSAILTIPSSIILGIKLINGYIVDAPLNMRFFDERLFRAQLTFPFSRAIVGNSKAGLKAYNTPKNKGLCIYNGFDNNRIFNLKSKDQIREELALSTKKVVGMVGGFFDRKDYETYIQAALKLLNQGKDVTFIAVGDGPNLMKCKKMIPVDYAPYFIFTGMQTDVESIVNVFDIGVLATNSEVHGEGISNAILEYMALGKPVVATLGGGTNEIVLHEETGFLVSHASPEEMAEKLMYLLDNPSIATKMGQAGSARVLDFFSLDTMTKAYLELYKSLIKGD